MFLNADQLVPHDLAILSLHSPVTLAGSKHESMRHIARSTSALERYPVSPNHRIAPVPSHNRSDAHTRTPAQTLKIMRSEQKERLTASMQNSIWEAPFASLQTAVTRSSGFSVPKHDHQSSLSICNFMHSRIRLSHFALSCTTC